MTGSDFDALAWNKRRRDRFTRPVNGSRGPAWWENRSAAPYPEVVAKGTDTLPEEAVQAVEKRHRMITKAYRKLLDGQLRTTVATALGLVLSLAAAGCSAPPPSGRFLEVEMRASAGTFSQVFWSNAHSFTEERSVRLPLKSAG